MVFTLKNGNARNVGDFSQYDTSTYFYAISYFYFLLNAQCNTGE